jgi:hypothetical protein
MRNSRSRREASEANGKHLKLIQAESDLTNLGHTMQDQTAGKIRVMWPWRPSVNQPIFVGFNC